MSAKVAIYFVFYNINSIFTLQINIKWKEVILSYSV